MPSREENVTELNNNNIIQYEAGELVCKIFLFRSNDFATIVNGLAYSKRGEYISGRVMSLLNYYHPFTRLCRVVLSPWTSFYCRKYPQKLMNSNASGGDSLYCVHPCVSTVAS